MESKQINSIDLMRLIASFFVVCIHVPCAFTIVPVARFAVPVFFILSGFLYKNFSDTKRKYQIKKILYLTLFSNIFYALYNGFAAFAKHETTAYISEIFQIKNLLNFILLNDSPFEHLWFFSALLYCLIFCFYFTKLNKDELFFVVIPILLAINLIFGKYSLLIFGKMISYKLVRNFLFMGLPFFYIGYLLSQANISKIKVNNIGLLILIVLLCITTLFEYRLLKSLNAFIIGDLYISTPFLSLAIFFLALQNPLKEPSGFLKMFINAGRKYSLMIYIVHPVIHRIIHFLIIQRIKTEAQSAYFYIAPLVVFVLSLIFSIFYYSLKKKIINIFNVSSTN